MFDGMTVIAGPARCGKTEQLLKLYRQALADSLPGSALWLAPTVRCAAEVRQRLLGPEMSACFSPNVLTFDQFAQAVLDVAPVRMRRISRLMRRSMLRSLVQSAAVDGRLKYFKPIAESPGLVDLVAGLVSELKRLEIWPEDFLAACRGRGLTDKDRELAGLYASYQEQLVKHNLYDAEGCFWNARTLMQEGQTRPFERLQAVIVDGFTDLTRTQHEMLKILDERTRSLVVSLPLESEPRRNDVFSKPLLTLERLKAQHPQLKLHTIERPRKPAWRALVHLEQQLFQSPARVHPASEAKNIEILAASGQLGEIELLARRIKSLLIDGEAGQPAVCPQDVLVVFRSLADTSELVREVFRQHGIPLSLESSRALSASPVLTALIAFLRLDAEDWPFRSLLAVLSHNYFRPAWPERTDPRAITAAEHLIRQLQIPAGRGELLAQLKRWAAQLPAESNPDAGKKPNEPRLLRAQQASLAWPLLARLSQAFEALPPRATPRHWADALTMLASDLGMLPLESAADDSDRQAWQTLVDSLGAAERLAIWCDQQPAEITRRELLDQVLDIVRNESLPEDRSDLGAVRVISAISARNLSAPYVFVAGLSEKSFPPPDRDERLYSEAETAGLIQSGLPLPARSDRSQEEMLLFYEVLTRPTRRLYLSYPALDESAQPLSPSPFLLEVERAFGVGVITRTIDLDLTPIPANDQVTSTRDWRVKAVAAALDGDHGLLAGFCRSQQPATIGNLLAGLNVLHARQHGGGYGAFEGLLTSPAAQENLAARFGPDRCWSPSRLEQYAFCPYQFYLERVLKLEPLEDLSLEVDHLARGRLLHGALATLHRRINERLGSPGTPCGQEASEFLQATEEILASLVALPGGERPITGALREIDRRLLTQWLANYRLQHDKYDAQWRECERPLRPTYFEASFGPTHEEVDDPEQPALEVTTSDSLSTTAPLTLKAGEQEVRIGGRIDRIDVGVVAGQTVFNIVDYKSGSATRFSAKSVTDALALQLPLYALAVQELLLAKQQAVPWRAAYWFVKSDGYKMALSFHSQKEEELLASPEWEALRFKLLGRVISLVQGVRQGQIPMHSADDECTSHCNYSTVCRVRQARALEKTWEPPQVEIP